MKFISLIILIVSFLFFTSSVNAQDTGWIIKSYNSNIEILKNGEVEVTENIQVDYGSLKKHGIFRDIPYAYALDSGMYYTEIIVKKITLDNNEEKYKLYKSGNNIQLKIGNPDKTISGQHNYLINFIVRGVILPYGDFDEFYWDATGIWPVPIEKASAIVSLPSESITQTSCYTGQEGSSDMCKTVSSSQTASFSSEILDPGEQMTIAVGFEKGTVSIITIPKPKSIFEKMFEPLNIGLFLFPIVGGFVFILNHWYRNGRDLWSRGKHLFNPQAKESIKPIGSHDQIVVEYIPPENFRPAELGVLMDERADTLDVTATIIDLAARGYLTIVEVPKKWMFGKVDYQLNKKKEPDSNLHPYEKTLIKRLFEDLKMVKISELKNKFYDDLGIVKKELYNHVVKEKLFPINPEKVRGKYILIGILILFGCIFGIAFIHVLPFQMFLGGGIFFAILFIIFSRSMPRRTAYGQELYRRARGYYLFISHVEKYKQQFFERKNILNEILPYAIVFGLTGKFAKALKDMGVKPPQPSWYVGHTVFDISSFEENLNTFSSSMSSAISSAPRSSGSSGGGSSGGGFGGGGGGSW